MMVIATSLGRVKLSLPLTPALRLRIRDRTLSAIVLQFCTYLAAALNFDVRAAQASCRSVI